MRTPRLSAIVILVLVPATTAPAWHGKGHDLASRAAVAAAGSRMPAFFTEGADMIAHVSQDPDAFTRPIAPPQLHEAESPEHYFDIELLEGKPTPPGRYEFIEFCAANNLRPAKVGLLPYAITEWTQRLTVALAEHRRWPDDPAIRAKCLVYAGLLAHYAADACQPLHLTIHWDGRAQSDGSSPRSGIHLRVDSLPNALRTTPAELAKNLEAGPFAEVMPAVLAEFDRSRGLIDKVYELEGRLPPAEDDKPSAENVVARLPAGAPPSGDVFVHSGSTGYIRTFKFHWEALPAGLKITPPDLPEEVSNDPNLVQQLGASLDRVREQVYHSPTPGSGALSDEVTELATERMRAAAAFIASLFLTAWQDSAKIELPPWHRARTMPRAAGTEPSGPASIEILRGGVFYPTRATISR